MRARGRRRPRRLLPASQLSFPLGDGQRVSAGAPDDWARELLLGLGRDDGVDARETDEGRRRTTG